MYPVEKANRGAKNLLSRQMSYLVIKCLVLLKQGLIKRELWPSVYQVAGNVTLTYTLPVAHVMQF